METKAGILLKNVTFCFGDEPTVDGISLEAPQGTLAAMLGPNGAGKSTLLKIISGYLKPNQGEVFVRGNAVHALTDLERSRLVTYLAPNSRSAFEFTVEQVVMMGRLPYSSTTLRESPEDKKAMERAIADTGIGHLRGRTVTSLSSGEQQRVQIARAICQDPEVLLLDEPTAHLDMAFELGIMDLVSRLVRNRKRTVLAVFHDVNLALRYASVLFFMKSGRLAHVVKPEKISTEIIEEVYGVKSHILEDLASGVRFVAPYG